MTTPENRPDYLCNAYKQMAPHWELVTDVRGGTYVMRERGRKYLPKFPLESNGAYENRKLQSTFYNAFDYTLSGLVGMVFRKDPVLAMDVPVEIAGATEERDPTTGALIKAAVPGHAENIDLAGNHLDVFLHDVFDMAAHLGHAFIHVDMPKPLETTSTNAQVVTAYDQRVQNVRPYWIKYGPQDALNWQTEVINGVEQLTQITFREQYYQKLGAFGEELITRYRVLTPGAWAVYKLENARNGQQEAVLEDSGTTSLNVIPVVAVYGRKTGFLTSIPPLLDLGYLNIEHWQLRSDYRHILHVANVPILVRKGYTPVSGKRNAEQIGPNRIMDVPEKGDLKYVEHQGTAIGHARTELGDIEERMAVIGLQLLARRTGASAKTATEKVMDAAESSSLLQEMVRSLGDNTEAALDLHARYLKKPDGGSITINKDFQGLAVDPAKLQVYSQMVQEGQLSLVTLWSMMKTYGDLPPTFDAAVEQQSIKDEAPLRLNVTMSTTPPKPQGPTNPDGGSQRTPEGNDLGKLSRRTRRASAAGDRTG